MVDECPALEALWLCWAAGGPTEMGGGAQRASRWAGERVGRSPPRSFLFRPPLLFPSLRLRVAPFRGQSAEERWEWNAPPSPAQHHSPTPTSAFTHSIEQYPPDSSPSAILSAAHD